MSKLQHKLNTFIDYVFLFKNLIFQFYKNNAEYKTASRIGLCNKQ